MFKRFGSVVTVLLLLLLVFPISAQEVPAAIDFAVADLGERLGQPLTRNNVPQWLWSGDLYPDASLGCPQPGQSYIQTPTSGFQFMLTYGGTTYDYRVSADGSIVIQCASYAAGTAPELGVPAQPSVASTPGTPTTDTPVVDTLPPVAACPELLPPRLSEGAQARVQLNITSLNLRAAPDLTADIITRMPRGTQINLVSGPVCGPANIAWWEVAFDTFTGWAAEGQRNIYYLEPLTVADPALEATPAAPENTPGAQDATDSPTPQPTEQPSQ